MRTGIWVVCAPALAGVSRHLDNRRRALGEESGDTTAIHSILNIEHNACPCCTTSPSDRFTGPGGKWKKYITAFLGNLIQAIEPNPGND